MEAIKYCNTKNNICVISLILFYENNVLTQKKVYRVLSCVVYYLIDHYVCIDYLLRQLKPLRFISSNLTFEEKVLICYSVLEFQLKRCLEC